MEDVLLKNKNGLDIFVRDGKVFINSNENYHNGIIENQEMEEIPLGITKEDIYKMMLEKERDEIRAEKFIEKIARIFRRQKRLPPYSEIKTELLEPNSQSIEERPSWELTREQRDAIKPVNMPNNFQSLSESTQSLGDANDIHDEH